jgi:hypothetical protein
MAGIVWVLGAGFSKALGGPMLPQLLGQSSRTRVTSRFKDLESRVAPFGDIVRRILASHGWEDRNGSAAWRDAEEFLEFLDLAARNEDSPHFRALNTYAGGGQTFPSASGIAGAARRLVAAECCFFDVADVNYERWAPYRKWAAALKPEDTVVTFNYDRVVEAAARAASQAVDLCLDPVIATTGKPRLLKLHGSVDWKVISGRIAVAEECAAVACHPDELAIACPGPSKYAFRAENEQIESLWKRAEDALRDAEAIVFVGYRFPPSDAMARERLLEAITANEIQKLTVHTVLGDNRRDPATTRLVGLLTHALRKAGRMLPAEQYGAKYLRLVSHPLFAEDFLGIVDRKQILRSTWDYPS